MSSTGLYIRTVISQLAVLFGKDVGPLEGRALLEKVIPYGWGGRAEFESLYPHLTSCSAFCVSVKM